MHMAHTQLWWLYYNGSSLNMSMQALTQVSFSQGGSALVQIQTERCWDVLNTLQGQHAIITTAETVSHFVELHKWGAFEDARSPPVVSVGVGSGKIDQRFVEEDAYNNHQCSDSMRSPAERGFDGRGRVGGESGRRGRGRNRE